MTDEPINENIKEQVSERINEPMETYQLASISANPLKGESWERIAKFIAVNIVVGIAITLIFSLITVLFMSTSRVLSILLMLGVFIAAQAFMLSWYEQWRGCKFQQ